MLKGQTQVEIAKHVLDLLLMREVPMHMEDMIEAADVSAANNKDFVNTKTTARRGDYIDVDYSDADGWVITRKRGTWAKEG